MSQAQFDRDIEDMLINAKAVKGEAFYRLIQLLSAVSALYSIAEPEHRESAEKARLMAVMAFKGATNMSTADVEEAIRLYSTMQNVTNQYIEQGGI